MPCADTGLALLSTRSSRPSDLIAAVRGAFMGTTAPYSRIVPSSCTVGKRIGPPGPPPTETENPWPALLQAWPLRSVSAGRAHLTGSTTAALDTPWRPPSGFTLKNSAQSPGCWFGGTTKLICSTPIIPGASPSNRI